MDLNQKKQNNNEQMMEIVRFLLVGGLATICDYAVYLLFRKFLLPPELLAGNPTWDAASAVIATTLGFAMGLLINWVLSVLFVFRNTAQKVDVTSKADFIKFTVIALIGLLFTQVAVGIGVLVVPSFSLFGGETFLSLGWNEWLIKAVTTGLVLVFNYFARKKYIFHN